MKFYPILILIILSFVSSKSYAQAYSEDNRKFVYQNKITYEIITIDTEDEYGNKPELHIKKLIRGESEKIQSIDIPYKGSDADMISFGNFINKEKKYLIIQARYNFYILNLYNNKLLGPYSPKFIGIGQDAQSAMLSEIKIILDGRFIIGYCVDSGSFLFDLTDLYHPKEVIPVNHPVLNQNHIYILKHIGKENDFFGLFLSAQNWTTNSKIIFTHKNVSGKNFDYVYKMSDSDLEDLSIDDHIVERTYTILKEIISEGSYSYFVIDNNTGKPVHIPEHLKKATREKIFGYLYKNLN